MNFSCDDLCVLLDETIDTVETGNCQKERVVTSGKERSVTIANNKPIEKENQTSNFKMIISPILPQD